MLGIFFQMFGGQIGGKVCGFFTAGPGHAILPVATISLMNWLTIGQWAFNLMVGYLALQVRKIETLRHELKTATSALVKAEMQAITSDLKQKMDSLSQDLSRVTGRLDRGDNRFENLGERNHEIRLQVAMQMGDLKTQFVETFATKEDLEKIGDKFDQLKDIVLRQLIAGMNEERMPR